MSCETEYMDKMEVIATIPPKISRRFSLMVVAFPLWDALWDFHAVSKSGILMLLNPNVFVKAFDFLVL